MLSNEISKLRNSTVSTRAIYGDHKNFAPFPRLKGNPIQSYDKPKCSMCQINDGVYGLSQVWLSFRAATDVLPLLVYTCSKECVEKIPSGENGYIAKYHEEGIGLNQPEKKSMFNKQILRNTLRFVSVARKFGRSVH